MLVAQSRIAECVKILQPHREVAKWVGDALAALGRFDRYAPEFAGGPANSECTMRDLFAAHALAALASRSDSPERIVRESFEIADRMLVARRYYLAEKLD